MSVMMMIMIISSVLDPSHFDVDPDVNPGIHIWKNGSRSGSSDPHLENVDPDPGPKWIRIRVPIFHKEIHVGQITILIFVTAKI